MLRVFIALNLLLLNLFACNSFKACRLKTIESHAIGVNSLHIPLKGQFVLLTQKPTSKIKIIKSDPFLSLYLVKEKKAFKYPFVLSNTSKARQASLNNTMTIRGKIVKKQTGINSLASFSEAVSFPSLIVNEYCAIDGIVTEKGIIQKSYLEHFLNAKDNFYGDIGIRVEDRGSKVIVSELNPFLNQKRFVLNDEVITFDEKKIKDSAELMESILFAKKASKHKLTVLRNNKKKIISAVVQKRVGGGELSDTFLENKGLYFDKDLTLAKVAEGKHFGGIKEGDKLVKINNVSVKNYEDVRKELSQLEKLPYLLFSRNGFQFFIRLN